jgi:hypothetical protein
MIYDIVFYLCAFNCLFQSFTGNVDMVDKSFKGLVICGFINLFHKLDGLNRR